MLFQSSRRISRWSVLWLLFVAVGAISRRWMPFWNSRKPTDFSAATQYDIVQRSEPPSGGGKRLKKNVNIIEASVIAENGSTVLSFESVAVIFPKQKFASATPTNFQFVFARDGSAITLPPSKHETIRVNNNAVTLGDHEIALLQGGDVLRVDNREITLDSNKQQIVTVESNGTLSIRNSIVAHGKTSAVPQDAVQERDKGRQSEMERISNDNKPLHPTP